MRNKLLGAVCAAVVTLGAAGASAQETRQTTTTTTTITTENRDRIRTYVTKQKPKQVQVQEQIRVGSTLPATVQLETFPSDVGVTQYRYVYLGDRIALVEPQKRQIVEIIDVR